MRWTRGFLLLVVAALALVVSACSVGVGTPPDEYAAEHAADDDGGGGGNGGGGDQDVNLFVDGPEDAIDDLRAEIGGENPQALLVSISEGTVFVEVPGRESGQADRYKWDPADGATSLGTRGVSDPTLEPFPLNSVDFAAIPDLVADAPAEAGLQGQISSTVDIRRAGGQTLMTVSMVTPRGDAGAVVADADGEIVSSS